MQKVFSPLLQISLYTFGYLYATSNTALAQVTSDGTVNTQVNQNGNVAEITGGQTRGSNLFHSFRDFSVDTGDTASFLNSNDIANIFSRVTGGNISSINGLIRANGNADLFLINPAGILFGENARLDVGGSFLGSTASGILFEDGEFSATNLTNPPLLTINAPIGLNLRDNPGDIVNRSRALDSNGQDILGFQVKPGKNLAFVGGNVSLESGVILAPEGRVELGGLSEAGTVEINNDGSLSFPENIARSDVFISNEGAISVTGEQGGSIAVNAQKIEISGNSILLGGGLKQTGLPNSKSGDIVLNAIDAIDIDSSIISNTIGFVSLNLLGIGNAGNINITTGSLALTNRAKIDSSNYGTGNAGNITVKADNNFSVAKSLILSNIGSPNRNPGEGNGKVGNISIEAKEVSLTDNAQLQAGIWTGGQGQAGIVSVNAQDSIFLANSGIFSDVESGAGGNGSDIELSAKSISLTDGARLKTSNAGQGNAGNITIKANDTLSVAKNSFVLSNIGSFNGNPGEGNGKVGNISIEAKKVSLTGTSQLQAGIFTGGQGEAGVISVKAQDSIVFNGLNSGIFSNVESEAEGNGSDIELSANSISLTDGAGLTADNAGQGNAGNVNVNSTNLSVNRGVITAATAFGEGGNINLKIDDTLTMRNNSLISAKAINDASGGNVNIDTNFIIAFPNQIDGNGSDIIASAAEGDGGRININAESLLGIQERKAESNNQTNDIDASSEFGLDGTVSIFTPDINPVQGATELPNNVIKPEQTTDQACQANREAAAKNGLVINGKGGIPAPPDQPLTSQNLLINGEITSASAIPEPIETSQGKIQLARGIKVTKDGQVILTPYPTNNAGERMPEIKPNCS